MNEINAVAIHRLMNEVNGCMNNPTTSENIHRACRIILSWAKPVTLWYVEKTWGRRPAPSDLQSILSHVGQIRNIIYRWYRIIYRWYRSSRLSTDIIYIIYRYHLYRCHLLCRICVLRWLIVKDLRCTQKTTWYVFTYFYFTTTTGDHCK